MTSELQGADLAHISWSFVAESHESNRDSMESTVSFHCPGEVNTSAISYFPTWSASSCLSSRNSTALLATLGRAGQGSVSSTLKLLRSSGDAVGAICNFSSADSGIPCI